MNNQPKPQRARKAALQMPINVQVTKVKRRRRNRQADKQLDTIRFMNPQPMGVSNGPSAPIQKLNQGLRRALSHKLSPDGVSFLKCAFAPPDFQSNKISGVTDKFEGQTLVKKHRLVASFTFDAAKDVYFLLAPVPGYAYFKAVVTAGTPIDENTNFEGIPYSDLVSMFGGDPAGKQTADTVQRFRFISNHFELVPTTNAMSWTGSIQAYKIMLATATAIGNPAGDTVNLVGLQGCNTTNANQYTGPFNLGVYTGAYSRSSVFNFQTVLENTKGLPQVLYPENGGFGRLLGDPYMTGLDSDFETVCIKVSGIGANANNTTIIKTWACVEYLVNPGSSLYEYTTFSPCDEDALAVYRKIIQELPVGVSYLDNESFWRRVLGIIQKLSGTLTVLPGPYGMAAGGINSLSTAITQMTM